MALWPKLPEGIGALRKFNTLMVVIVTSSLLASRFFQNNAEVVAQSETVSTVAGIALAVGILAQFLRDRR